MDLIDQQFESIRKQYHGAARLERRPDGSALITIQDFPLPEGWNKKRTSLAFVIPVGYPFAQPDTFWADPDLRLAYGGFPPNTDLNTRYGGHEPRLWFSYHPATWEPSRDTISTYLRLVRQRLSQI